MVDKDILHNILNVQMVVDYAKESKQEIFMTQWDIEKVYDHVSWLFLAQLMLEMGFGIRMSRLTFMLGSDAVSHVMFVENQA
jgi:hypothetical protein